MGTTSPLCVRLIDSTTYSAADPTQCRKVDNTGAEINMQAKDVTMTINGLTNAEPVPNKVNTLAWNAKLAYGDFVGNENPTFSMTGLIDIEDSTPAEGAYVDNQAVTLKMLLKMFKSGHVFIMKDVYDTTKSATPNAGYYRLHALDSSENATTINVILISLTVNSDAGRSKEGQFAEYTLDMLEVRV